MKNKKKTRKEVRKKDNNAGPTQKSTLLTPLMWIDVIFYPFAQRSMQSAKTQRKTAQDIKTEGQDEVL